MDRAEDFERLDLKTLRGSETDNKHGNMQLLQILWSNCILPLGNMPIGAIEEKEINASVHTVNERRLSTNRHEMRVKPSYMPCNTTGIAMTKLKGRVRLDRFERIVCIIKQSQINR